MELSQKHVLVTGAAKRLGRAIAHFFYSNGCRVSAHFHQSELEINELVQSVEDRTRIQPCFANLRSLSDVAALHATALRAFGPVDILINSASVFLKTPADCVTESDWGTIIDINLRAPFFLAQHCANGGMGERGGLIVNIADIFGTRALKRFAPYGISKSGIIILSKILAKEWAPNIRVNSISPGSLLLPDDYQDGERKRAAARTLLKRTGDPSDLIGGINFLCQNDYVTGLDLVIDGGQSLIH